MSEQVKSKVQHPTHATDDDGCDNFVSENGASPPNSFDLNELGDLDEEQDEEQDDHDRLYMSQDHRGSRHRSNAPTRHAHTDARTDASQTRRPHFQQERARSSVATWEVGRNTDLRHMIDGRHVNSASRLLHPNLRQSPANSHAPSLTDAFPHRASSSTSVSFMPGGSLSRHIDTRFKKKLLT